MTMIKRGKCCNDAVVSSAVLVCPSCGYTKMASKLGSSKSCPKCNALMSYVSASVESKVYKEAQEENQEEAVQETNEVSD